MTHTSYQTKRRITKGLMVVFVLGLVSFGIFVSRRDVYAQDTAATNLAELIAGSAEGSCLRTAAVPSTCPFTGIRLALKTVGEKILTPPFRIAMIQALMNLSRFVLDRLAYEAAVAIASGDAGEESLFHQKTPGDAFAQLGLEAAGEAVATLSDLSSEALGVKFNLCAPTNPLISLALSIGIKQKYRPSKPRCDILEVGAAWGSFFTNAYQTITDPDIRQEAILSKFAESLKPGKNELSAILRVNIAVDGKVREQKLLALIEMSESDYKDVTDFLTGTVKTPASTLQKDFDDKVAKSANKDDVKVGDLVSAGDLIGGLVLTTASTFTNTLLSTLFSRIYTGLFDTSYDIDPFDVEATATGGKEAAQERFASIITTNPISTQEYNALSEFIVCPTEGVSNRGLYNCVMDVNFLAAVSRGTSGAAAALTVQEAIDEGLLNGDWPLINSQNTASNQDQYCYSYGYCYGNLVKLRKARVIPIGWELAALRNDTTNPSTLQEVIDGFDDCTEDGTVGPAGASNDSSSWCHLIDPNWVLKYPETQCRAVAPGEIRISTLVAGRASTCVDTPSCIGENNDGECSDGYGYCVREENVWRFRGEECPQEYATCLSFENTFTGDTDAYRVSSVDYSVCNADNAGCRWYRTQKHYEDAGTSDDDSDDSYEWLPDGETYTTSQHEADWKYTGSTGVVSAPDPYGYTSESGTTYAYSNYSYEDRIYLTNEATECSEDDAGCTLLNEFDDDLVLNHIQNPSFEDDEDGDDFPDDWINSNAAMSSAQTMLEDDAVYGSFSFLTDESVLEQYVSLSPNNFYTLSFSARANDTSALETSVSVYLYDEYGEGVSVAGTSYGGDCAQSASSYSYVITADPTDDEQFTALEWSQFDCTFTTPEDVAQGLIYIESDEILLDAFQLELGEDVSDFTEGYSTSAAEVYYQVAPDYLACTGNETDPSACDDYTQMCSAQEVGCNLYAPEDGDPDVPAIISELDECPEECVGYTTYKQEATDYDSEEFPLYFIADRASACSSQYIGCDSYTNLSAIDAGGEGTESYSALRFCLSEDIIDGSNARKTPATFFTWEGSDNAGYQLQTWYLLESNTTATSRTFTTSSYSENLPSLAPCTHVLMGSENEVVCNDTNGLMATDVWDNADCDEHDDIFDNPDCREFFDTEGNIHYREYPDTISISDECAPYRKDESTETDCDDSGGYWTDQGFCRYYVLADESTQCPDEQSGCREYTGGTGRNATTILSETFEDGTYDDFVIYEASGATASLSVSNESVATDGHSLYVSGTSGSAGFETIQIYLDSTTTTDTYDEAGDADTTSPTTTCVDGGGTIGDSGCDVYNDVDSDGSVDEECTIEDGEESCGTLTESLVGGKTFVVDFWAKGSGDLYVSMVETGGSGTSYDMVDPQSQTTTSPDALELTGSWRLYSLGPLDTSSYTNFDENAVLRFAVATGVIAYIDNITIKQVEEDITIIKDSWVVPSTCDSTPGGVASDQYYLGCEAYSDQNGNDADLYQFTSICSEEVVGCEGFYDTGNFDSAYTQVFNARCMYSSNASFTDEPDVVDENTTCEIDDVEYCTISSGEAYCTFDVESVLAQPLPRSSFAPYFAVVFGPETIVVPADAPVYLVVDENYQCGETSMGCQEVGAAEFNQDQSKVDSFESAYYLNLPEDYDTLVCDDEALFCEEWESTQDGNFYFKDPLDKTCEYQGSITIDNQEYEGWFRTGTTEPCYWTDEDGDDAFDPSVDDSYLINGNAFGVWANGDDDYDSWVASCEDRYDLCTEFVDVVDTGGGLNENGASYYFTNDDLMSEDTLTDNQRCNGQVSQKFGCALFNNTTDSELRYNAGASYAVAIHADVFFGEAQNSLQDPVDCEIDEGGEFEITSAVAEEIGSADSVVVDLCARRCSYTVEDGDAIDTDSATFVSDTQYYERSCLYDEDCPALVTDLGEDVTGSCGDVVEAYALGNDVNEVLKVNRDRSCSAWLACESSKTSWNTATATYDTICDSINLCVEGTNQGDKSTCTQWDESDPEILSAYEYSARDVNWYGDEWSGNAIPNQLPVELYDQFNISPQTRCENTAGSAVENDLELPMSCSTYEDCGTDAAVACSSDAICEAAGYSICNTSTSFCYYNCDQSNDTDYRLVYNAGSCDSTESGDGNGGSCVVGTCEDSGSACASGDDCADDDECVVGYCQTTGTTDCVTSDCSCNPENETGGIETDCKGVTTFGGTPTLICDPVQFVCVDVLTSDEANRVSCVNVDDCSSEKEQKCIPASTSVTGSCFNNRCLSDIKDDNGDGYADALAVSGGEVTSGREMSCRGYPEIDSPFSIEVVDSWKTFTDENIGLEDEGLYPVSTDFSADDDDPPHSYSLPYDYVGGFNDSTICGLPYGKVGESADCDCSYAKAEYGEGATYRYFDAGEGAASDEVPKGICSGGSLAGIPCVSDGDCTVERSTGTQTGTCSYLSGVNTLYGWEGYCLEKDTSIQTLGSAETENQACLSWLPVDQLSGSTDLYGKVTSAGYAPQDTYYCADVDLAYNIQTSNIACAESDNVCSAGGLTDESDWGTYYDVANETGVSYDGSPVSVFCPNGYFAIMTGCSSWDQLAYEGIVGETNDYCAQGWGDADYPYFCVPKFSYKTQDDGGGVLGDQCLTPGYYEFVHTSTYNTSSYEDHWNDGLNLRVYVLKPSAFITARTFYDDCEVKGVFDLANFLDPYETLDDVPQNEYMESCVGLFAGTCGYYYDVRGVTGAKEPTFLNLVPYPTCSTLVQVSSTQTDEQESPVYTYNAAWTDRLWNDEANTFSIVDPADQDAYFAYAYSTELSPYGSAVSYSTKGLDTDPYAHKLTRCRNEDYESETPTVDLECDSSGYSAISGDARAFLDVSLVKNEGDVYEEYCEDSNCDCEDSSGAESDDMCNDQDGDEAGTTLIACEGTVCESGDEDGNTCTLGEDADEDGYNDTCGADGECVGTCNAGPYSGYSCGGEDDVECEPNECIGSYSDEGSLTGTGCATQGTAPPSITLTVKEDVDDAINRLLQLFGRIYGMVQFDDNGYDGVAEQSVYEGGLVDGFKDEPFGSWTPYTYDEVASAVSDSLLNDWRWDTRSVGDDDNDPIPPTIVSVGDCVGTDCEEDTDGKFNIGEVDSGDLEGEGTYRANVSFFAYADSNQMPIRRIIIDWGADFANAGGSMPWPTGSQSGSTAPDNFYKNYRGLNAYGAETCSSSADEFGESTEACSTSYINFSKDYICTKGNLDALADRPCIYKDDGRLENSPCLSEDSLSCVFQPRVHVIDNWGWCTGFCNAGADDSDGCFSGETEDGDPVDECNITNCPSEGDSDSCEDGDDDSTATDVANPWINFDGTISITPD